MMLVSLLRFPSLRIVSLRIALAAALSMACGAVAAKPLGEADARHLLARTGFGPAPSEIAAYAPLSRDDAIEQLLAGVKTTSATPPPEWTRETGPLRTTPAALATEADRKAFQQEQASRVRELRAWWMREMLVTPSPLTERMTLFWHNHFVSSQQKVRVGRLLYAQNAMFRAQSLGSFATLLHAAATDPAMVIYLDSVQNRKGTPNENFAREVMELFTLGQGHYDEQDVKEAARAFTGWSIDRDTGTFVVRPRLHDTGEKAIFGRFGQFDGDAVLDLLLARPETAEFIVGKLWREFVSPDPDSREVRRIAVAFRESNYDLKVALRNLLQSPAFWAADNRGSLIKSPVEIVVGSLRQLDVTADDTLALALVTAGMGQNLFAPPNVRGWPGGDVWINSNTLLARKQFLDRLARNDAGPPPGGRTMMRSPAASTATPEPVATDSAMTMTRDATVEEMARAARVARQIDRGTRGLRFDAAQWIAQCPGDTRERKMDAAARALLPIAAQLPPTPDADMTSAIYAMLLDPAYQLK